jgi:hypothetical protein
MPFDLGPGARSGWLAGGLRRRLRPRLFGVRLLGDGDRGVGLVTNPLNFVAVVVLLETRCRCRPGKGAGPDVDWRRVGWLLAGAAVGCRWACGR